MATYHLNEGTLSLPDGWTDRTVHAFALPSGATSASASMTITREPLSGAAATLPSYLDRQLVELARSCPRFELLGRRMLTVDGIEASQLDFSWRTPDRVMVRQQQTVLLLGRQVLTLTASAPAAKFEGHLPAFQALLESFKVRR